MPIRIRDDQNSGNYSPRNPGGGGSGGGGGLGNLIPLLIGLFGKNPKMLLIIAVIGGIMYFAGGKGCSSVTDPTSSSEGMSGLFSLGASFNKQKYESNEIYEPLSDNKTNPLPEKFSLLEFAPKRLNQGQQGSCVAWAAAYGARSIMQSRESGNDPNSSTFSPAFLYNQIALEGCQGSYLTEAMKVMQSTGTAPYNDMPYTDQDCSARPNSMQLKKAEEFRITGSSRLTGGRNGEDATKVDLLAVKQHLSQGAPVVIGMMVGGTFMQNMMGKEMWQSTDSDQNMSGFGGHAMCVIGYDDFKYAKNMGGFQIMNSWGEEWGNKGVAWVSYDDFEIFVKEAYGIYPMGDARATSTSLLNAQLGIVLNKDNSNLSLDASGTNLFRSSRKMTANEEFKLEVVNNIACYVYVFGQETDGSSYVLFPYTKKHSPYCGVTGRRLFPRDFSMYPDDKGNADYFAIVVSKKPLDFDSFNSKLSSAAGSTYMDKLNATIGNQQGVQMNGGKQIQLAADLSRTEIMGVVIEVQK
jgi:C1A family cysteine protease